jgi:energy-coupling factor transporter transmembrane protein EcfT
MFDGVGFYYVVLPAVLVVAIMIVLAKRKIDRESDTFKRALETVRLYVAITLLLSMLLWCLLPNVAVLGSFGYPTEANSLQDPALLLNYLQSYNKAIVRTTQVVQMFLLFFAALFLATLYVLTSELIKLKTATRPEASGEMFEKRA